MKNGVSDHGKALGVLGSGSLVGVNLDRFNRERIRSVSKITRASIGLNEDDFVVVFAARKSIDKGALDMLRAFAIARRSVNRMKLVFVGPDESNGALEQLRTEAPEVFEGVLDFGLVKNHEEHLALSDVLCLPSYREGFGSVVIDAAALGVPCVGSRIPGLVDAIADGETGLLFPVGDTKQLANILIQLESDRGALKKLGEAAKARVKALFTAEILYKHLADFYRTQLLLSDRARSGK